MKFDDKGFLLSKSRYSENSVIAEFYTKNHGKCSGIIFGATSKNKWTERVKVCKGRFRERWSKALRHSVRFQSASNV